MPLLEDTAKCVSFPDKCLTSSCPALSVDVVMRAIWAEPLVRKAGVWKSYSPNERRKRRDGGRAAKRLLADEVSTVTVKFKTLLKANRCTGERFEYGKKLMAAHRAHIESAVSVHSVQWMDLTLVLSCEYKLWKKAELMILDHLNLKDTLQK